MTVSAKLIWGILGILIAIAVLALVAQLLIQEGGGRPQETWRRLRRFPSPTGGPAWRRWRDRKAVGGRWEPRAPSFVSSGRTTRPGDRTPDRERECPLELRFQREVRRAFNASAASSWSCRNPAALVRFRRDAR